MPGMQNAWRNYPSLRAEDIRQPPTMSVCGEVPAASALVVQVEAAGARARIMEAGEARSMGKAETNRVLKGEPDSL